MTGRGWRARYGAGPLHLIALLASLAIAAAAVVGWFQRPHDVVGVLEWFVAAAVIHDLVLLPLYALLDRVVLGPVAARHASRRGVNPVPYLRIPALLSGLLLLVFFPVIFGLGAQSEKTASGITENGYLVRWLLVTGALFALSGALCVIAGARARRGATPQEPTGAPASE